MKRATISEMPARFMSPWPYSTIANAALIPERNALGRPFSLLTTLLLNTINDPKVLNIRQQTPGFDNVFKSIKKLRSTCVPDP